MNDIDVISSGAEPGPGDDHGPTRRKRAVAALAVLACAAGAWALNQKPAPGHQPAGVSPTHPLEAGHARAWVDAVDAPVILQADSRGGSGGAGRLILSYDLTAVNRDPVELAAVTATIDGASVSEVIVDEHQMGTRGPSVTLAPAGPGQSPSRPTWSRVAATAPVE